MGTPSAENGMQFLCVRVRPDKFSVAEEKREVKGQTVFGIFYTQLH